MLAQVAQMEWTTGLAVWFQFPIIGGESLVCHMRSPLDVAMAQCVQEPSGCSYGSMYAAETYGNFISGIVGSTCVEKCFCT